MKQNRGNLRPHIISKECCHALFKASFYLPTIVTFKWDTLHSCISSGCKFPRSQCCTGMKSKQVYHRVLIKNFRINCLNFWKLLSASRWRVWLKLPSLSRMNKKIIQKNRKKKHNTIIHTIHNHTSCTLLLHL